MKIGIISDTHDRLLYIDKAIKLLNKEEVKLVLHAGDYISPFVASRFIALDAELIGIFGNNDAEKYLIKRNFKNIGAKIKGSFTEIKTENLKIVMIHGKETSLLRSLIKTNYYDVIVYGHTHKSRIYREGKTLVINPGEVCGYLSRYATIALLDTETMIVKIKVL
jgi:putative phosphoesterase